MAYLSAGFIWTDAGVNLSPKNIRDSQLRKDAYVSAKLPLDKEDQCPEDLL
jgi:hypothetical protein